jgi:hypothetical protein
MIICTQPASYTPDSYRVVAIDAWLRSKEYVNAAMTSALWEQVVQRVTTSKPSPS